MSTRENVAAETVYVVDDDKAIRTAICNLLDSAGLRSEAFGSSEEFLSQWSDEVPACLVLDVRLPGMTGIEFQEKLSNSGIYIPTIFMTAHGDIPMVKTAIRAGAIEFLTKPFQEEELLAAIRKAFSAVHAHRTQANLDSTIRMRFASLRSREREVFNLVTSGLPNKQIADTLRLSIATVKLHRGHVMEKMRADSLAELVRMADSLKALEKQSSSAKS
jgi:FixJ family two-component response regulator